MTTVLVESVRKIHELELFDDLVLFAELNSIQAESALKLAEEEQAFVLMCIGNAHFELTAYATCIRYYERAQKALTTQCVSKASSAVVDLTELRFKLHRAYLKENRVEDAIKCLESVPEKDSVPKVRYALAKLLLQNRSTKVADVPPKVNHLFGSIVKDVPEAIVCRSSLVSNNVPHDALPDDASEECRAWLTAQEAAAQHNYAEAASILSRTPCISGRYLLEMARFYDLSGDRDNAVASYQRAHALDATNPAGMDRLALLYYYYKGDRHKELETLAGSLSSHGPSCLEMFVAFGYLACLHHRAKEALQFAHKAAELATAGQQRSSAMLLKAEVLFLTKRHKEAEPHFQEALSHDRRNVDAYEGFARLRIMQANERQASLVLHQAEHFLGPKNPRVQLIAAHVLTKCSPTFDRIQANRAKAIAILEEVTAKAPYLLDAVLLLAKQYERESSYDKAVKLLQIHAEKSDNGQLHRLLGDFLSKVNRPIDACEQYRQALTAPVPDPKALEALSNMDATPSLATPETSIARSFTPPPAPRRVRHAVRQHSSSTRRQPAHTPL
ncbi:TPR Domain containing protein [Aphelenchoides avenae]|nr:TPR Domain containing protein [Aphelenchus avenae]